MSDPHDLIPHDQSSRTPRPAAINRELGGDLPCVSCGYNLRGLSILSMCPECGVGVRATILSVVDPQASELQPIRFPKLLAAMLIVWAGGAAAVSMLSWLPHAADLAAVLGSRLGQRPSIGLGVIIGVLASGIGSIALIRPHTRIPTKQSLLALLGTLLYIPLIWVLWLYHTRTHGSITGGSVIGGVSFVFGSSPDPVALRLLALIDVLLAAIILALRPNARLLVARSLILRTGRVDRQTIYAVAVAAGIAAAGAIALSVFSQTSLEFLRIIALLGLAIGSLMVTLGLFGTLLDCLRIAQAILMPRQTIHQVMSAGAKVPRSKLSRVLSGGFQPPTTLPPTTLPPTTLPPTTLPPATPASIDSLPPSDQPHL